MRTAPEDADDRTTVQLRDPLLGTILDRRFRIEFQIASGGFGAIYRATDVRSNVEVALKVLHAKLARDPSVIERFRREGATLSNLRDPHTITAYEFGEAPDGTLYIVMELLHGESLYQQFHAGGPLPWRRVVHIARGVCSSLAEAHAYGIVHRDLKPANIHLETSDGDSDFVKVLDFGIAKIVQGGEQERTELTQAGQMIGTVDYMSPEQMVGGEMTGRSDIYTLGTVMYEMITGRMPFADAQTATAILAAVLTRTPDPVSQCMPVPPALDEIVARCLERDPQKRFTDIRELDAALAKVAGVGQARSSAPAARVDPMDRLIDRPTTAYARQTPVEASQAVPPAPELVASAPVIPATGFEPVATNEATRIDVRFSESSQPVLDARGPRYRMSDPNASPAAPIAPPAATPQANVSPIAGPHVAPIAGPHVAPVSHARGSQHPIEARGWQPQPGSRGSVPMVDLGTRAPQPAVRPAIPPPLRPVGPTPKGYDMAAVTGHDAIVRRIIWISLLVAVLIAILIAML